jgi:ribonuclease P protein component
MQRLKTRAQFQAALAGGTVARTPHFALHRCSLDVAEVTPVIDVTTIVTEDTILLKPKTPLFNADVVWIGAMVPKRWARRAVTRNAIKRQIYQVSTGCEAGFLQAAHVVRLRAGFDRKEFVSASSDRLKAAVRAELDQLFARAARDVVRKAAP